MPGKLSEAGESVILVLDCDGKTECDYVSAGLAARMVQDGDAIAVCRLCGRAQGGAADCTDSRAHPGFVLRMIEQFENASSSGITYLEMEINAGIYGDSGWLYNRVRSKVGVYREIH